jgi:release factor glutamine methyltransferase
MTTLRKALDLAVEELTLARQQRKLPIDTPRLDAQILLGSVLKRDRSYLYMYPEQELTPEEEADWHTLLARRVQGEPVAYLVANKAFFGLDFYVDRRVLIPRPETELLVEAALNICQAYLQQQYIPLIADIGTGSGAIPISLAVHEPRLASLYAVDVSPEALAVARLNCLRHQVSDRVHLLQGHLLEPLPEPVDLLLANLPYVGLDEQGSMLPDVLDYEPHLALFSGNDGLNLLRQLLETARLNQKLRAGAIILLEIGYQQQEPLTRLAGETWPQASISCLQDYAGWDRVIKIALPKGNRVPYE